MKKGIILYFSYYLAICSCLLPYSSLFAQTQQTGKAEMPITTNSEEARQLYLQGRDLRMAQYKFKEAADVLDKALSLDPDFALAHLERAMASMEGGMASSPDMESFRKHLQKASALKGNVSEGEQLMISSMEAQFNNKPEEAIALFTRLAELYPQDKNIQYDLGTFYFVNNNYDKAIEYYKKATAIDPDFAPVYNELGYAYTYTRDYPQAEAAYKNYISLVPQEANPYDSMGDLYVKMGKHEDAIKYFRKAAELDPENFNMSLTKAGTTMALMGKLEESRRALQEAESKATTNVNKVNNMLARAQTYLYEARYKDALQLADKAAQLLDKEMNPDYLAQLYLGKGEVYTQLRDTAQAQQSFDDYRTLKSTSEMPPLYLNNFDQRLLFDEAILAAKVKNFNLANRKAEEYKQMVSGSENPDVVKSHHALIGLIQYEAGNYQKAITALEQADQQHPRVLYVQALAHEKAGNKAKANELKNKLAALNEPDFDFALVKASMYKKPKVATTK
ncbi:tetratricopeptide repeat protein [Pontibacter kalidii]|uniref:tetratricopeptide repeat protein n=1 Tax=Pontibacter kalidii TaxID=2592049 RepID=UPI00224FADE6|nr:tetratricopeptide repeat protein [Pontibacter kalidii]